MQYRNKRMTTTEEATERAALESDTDKLLADLAAIVAEIDKRFKEDEWRDGTTLEDNISV